MAPAYAFHPMAREHLPMIRRWLKAPEVVRWWGDPDEQYPLVSGDLDHPDLDQFIAARGIDQFIGEPDLIDRGHGSGFIRQFAGGLLASGIPRVVTDPDPDNARAVRAYTKAGFQRERV